MVKKLIITESQLKTLINEELGISSDIIKKTNEIFTFIENGISNNKENVKKFDNYSINKFSVKFDFFDTIVNCSVECYNYYTKEYYEYSNIDTSAWSVYTGKRFSFMGIIVPCISGKIVKEETMDSLQHELEHLYQQVMMKKPFSNKEIYAQLKTDRYSEDEIIRKTANLVYGCLVSEQDGFVNGLYSYLMSLPIFFSMEALKESSTWELYSEMVSTFNEFKNNQKFIDELKHYKFTKNKVVQSLNRFITKIGKVIVKVQQDKYKKQGWRN